MNAQAQNLKEMEPMVQLVEILALQNMKQSEAFGELMEYAVDLQMRLSDMTQELSSVKEQLNALETKQSTPQRKTMEDHISKLENRMDGLKEKVTGIKNQLLETAVKAVAEFKAHGKEAMNEVLKSGMSVVKKMLQECRKPMEHMKTDYTRLADNIDRIGDEMKEISTGFANIGRIMTGKTTQPLDLNEDGVAATRAVNVPVKNAIKILDQQIEKLDAACNKLDQSMESLGKSEKKENVKDKKSLKSRLEKMKTVSKAQKQPVLNEKSMNKAACL